LPRSWNALAPHPEIPTPAPRTKKFGRRSWTLEVLAEACEGSADHAGKLERRNKELVRKKAEECVGG